MVAIIKEISYLRRRNIAVYFTGFVNYRRPAFACTWALIQTYTRYPCVRCQTDSSLLPLESAFLCSYVIYFLFTKRILGCTEIGSEWEIGVRIEVAFVAFTHAPIRLGKPWTILFFLPRISYGSNSYILTCSNFRSTVIFYELTAFV